MEDAVSESRRKDAWERYMLAYHAMQEQDCHVKRAEHTAKEQVDAAKNLYVQARKNAELAYAAYNATKTP